MSSFLAVFGGELHKNKTNVEQFDPFHTPTVKPETYYKRMELHGDTEEFQAVMDRALGYQDIEAYIDVAPHYAKARARENLMMDPMFFDEIDKKIGKGEWYGKIAIRLGAGHNGVYYRVAKDEGLKEIEKKMIFIGKEAVEEVFGKGTPVKFSYSPLEELERKYRLGELPLEDKNLSKEEKLAAEKEAKLLAAREFIAKNIELGIKPNTKFPKLERELKAARLVHDLSLEDCKVLAEMIYLKPDEEAFNIVRDYIKNKQQGSP